MYARAREDLDILSTRLQLIQMDYDWACSRGDPERVHHFGMRLRAITAERERLMRHLSEGAPSKAQAAR
jgi:hypothetical protein